jgi:hypothetical protein
MAAKTDAEILAAARESNDPKTRLLGMIVDALWDLEHAVVFAGTVPPDDYMDHHPHQ